MNLQEYRNKYNNYNNQITQLKIEQSSFTHNNQQEFDKLFAEKANEDKNWFVENFDYIWKHKDYFYNHSPFKDIMIDFLPIYDVGGLCAGAAFHSKRTFIFLQELIHAWNNGFLYKGYPIISYKKTKHNEINKQWFTYVDNNKEFVIKDDEYIPEFEIKNIPMICSNISPWERYKTIDILKKERM